VNLDLTSTQIAIAAAAGIVGAGYIAFILVPAVRAYGRVWERLAAGLLTLYILGTLVGVGAAVGLAVVWSYDQYG
jgi:transketolase C-terminal domain/subunit